MRHLKTFTASGSPNLAVTPVTMHPIPRGHHRGRLTRSPRLFYKLQPRQRLSTAAPARTAGRRVGAGAGATPKTVAAIRHGFLPRSQGLSHGSLPHLPLHLRRKNRMQLRIEFPHL